MQNPNPVTNVRPPAKSGWTLRVQVSEEHYPAKYEDWEAWVRYYWQIRNVMD
jgi:hypothetical protein